jgi:hypothetical protein
VLAAKRLQTSDRLHVGVAPGLDVEAEAKRFNASLDASTINGAGVRSISTV